jgi:hypothetical protein
VPSAQNVAARRSSPASSVVEPRALVQIHQIAVGGAESATSHGCGSAALAPNEAMVVTTGKTDARYSGFQFIDPWMIAPDARRNQVSLTNMQATPNADGTVTYVVSSSDLGVANWLDPTGLRDGFDILRWQAIGPGTRKEAPIKDHDAVKWGELRNLNIPRISPGGRRRQRAYTPLL